MVIRKYSNRRLYDTDESRYVTLEEVAERIRAGRDLRIVDVPSGDDLTQATLAQIILDSRGAARLLPVPLLYELIRMGDDGLAEFFGRYMTWALQVYQRVQQGARAMAPYNPLSQMSQQMSQLSQTPQMSQLPAAATELLGRLLSMTGMSGAWGGAWAPAPPPSSSAWQAPPEPPWDPPPGWNDPPAPATDDPRPAAPPSMLGAPLGMRGAP